MLRSRYNKKATSLRKQWVASNTARLRRSQAMYLKRNSPRNVMPDKTAFVWIVETLSNSPECQECMVWPFGTYPNGYGKLTIHQIKYQVHRISYIITRGSIPEGLRILHSCDNPPCFNPLHLRVGTAKDNTQDAITKGRMHCGERSGPSKCTDEGVRLIRDSNLSLEELSVRLSLTVRNIRRIRSRDTWKHLP